MSKKDDINSLQVNNKQLFINLLESDGYSVNTITVIKQDAEKNINNGKRRINRVSPTSIDFFYINLIERTDGIEPFDHRVRFRMKNFNIIFPLLYASSGFIFDFLEGRTHTERDFNSMEWLSFECFTFIKDEDHALFTHCFNGTTYNPALEGNYYSTKYGFHFNDD